MIINELKEIIEDLPDDTDLFIQDGHIVLVPKEYLEDILREALTFTEPVTKVIQ